jgi:hypothetical protein
MIKENIATVGQAISYIEEAKNNNLNTRLLQRVLLFFLKN